MKSRERARPAVWTVSLLRITIVTSVFASGGASASPGSVCVCPTCPQLHCGGVSHAIIQVRVFNGSFAADLNNTVLVSNETLEVEANVSLPLKINNPANCADLTEWVTNAGTIGNKTSCSTTFKANSNAGDVLEAIANASLLLSTGIWSGYMDAPSASGMDFNFTCVAGNVTIPLFTIPTGESSTGANFLSLSVGIGGLDGNLSLWHAGIMIEQTLGSNPTTTWRPWYEEYFPGTPGFQYLAIANTTMPQRMFAQVCTQRNGLDLYILTFYSASGSKDPIQGQLGSPFFPDATTAEWIAETPYMGANYGIPAFTSLEWYGTMWANQTGTNYYLFDALGDYAIADTHCRGCGEQFATPTSITNDSTSFYIDYST